MCLGTISWGRLKISYLHLPSGPHLVAVFHEEFTEAGPVDLVRVEVRCLQVRNQDGDYDDDDDGRCL